MFIYESKNLVNGKKYIGMCTRECDNYFGSGTIIMKAIKKYGKKNFKRKILETCSTIKELSDAEIKWIKKKNAVESDEYYNIDHGGFGGNRDTLKEYWSKIKDKKHARNWDKRIGDKNPMFNKKHTKEYKQNSSDRMKAYWANMSPEERKNSRNWYTTDKSIKNSNDKRIIKSKCGSNNPNAGKYKVLINDEVVFEGCLIDYYNSPSNEISYSSLKGISRRGLNAPKNKSKYGYIRIIRI